MWAPQLDVTEALANSVGHFLDCIASGSTPQTDGHAGLRVVRVLEAASHSMSDRGRVIDLPVTSQRVRSAPAGAR
jgi:hypothetical protein